MAPAGWAMYTSTAVASTCACTEGIRRRQGRVEHCVRDITACTKDKKKKREENERKETDWIRHNRINNGVGNCVPG